MGKTTGISWASATWNPFMGCTKVSPGCDFCYAERDHVKYGMNFAEVRRSKTKFDDPLRWRKPERIFTCSWSDWFHVDADKWRDDAWSIIRHCPQHTFLILTKRPGRIRHCLPSDWGDGWPNVWLGTSVESNEYLHRMRVLRDTPAALRFVSCEPLLGPLPDLDLTGFQWVIVGGESGSKRTARPMHPDWVRSIRDLVLDEGWPGDSDPPPPGSSGARPALHMKQWGSWTPDQFGRDPDAVWVSPDGRSRGRMAADAYDDLPDGSVRMRYAGGSPSSGGKHLDGVDWCEIPPTVGQTALV